MKGIFLRFLIVLSFIGCFAVPAIAENKFDNSNSLQGTKKAQVYFDVSVKDDKMLAFRMKLLDRTIKEMEEAGTEVTAVVGFRGGAIRFITKDDHYVLEEQVSNKKKIQDWIKHFSSNGIVVEVCVIAAEIFDISTEDFLPEIQIVGNGYISLVGYQAQGYSVVPMD